MKNQQLATCPRCGARSALFYDSVEDYYFGFEGKWDIHQCSNPDCGVAWPTPLPDDATLASAYGCYYTHEAQDDRKALQRIRSRLTAWLHRTSNSQRLTQLMGSLPIVGQFFEDCFWSSGGITPNAAGTVLDVGCGSGDRLSFFLSIGWGNAIGVDPDANAVKAGIALRRNINVGSADELPFGSGTMDAVVMHHVIEHVRDQSVALAEAYRVLKSGSGQLVVITPNVMSIMRERWGAHWRGFEVPRHLTIFSVPALQSAVISAGFQIEVARTSARSAAWINRVSREAAESRPARASLLARLCAADKLYRSQQRQITRGQYVGDEIVLVARKADTAETGNVRE